MIRRPFTTLGSQLRRGHDDVCSLVDVDAAADHMQHAAGATVAQRYDVVTVPPHGDTDPCAASDRVVGKEALGLLWDTVLVVLLTRRPHHHQRGMGQVQVDLDRAVDLALCIVRLQAEDPCRCGGKCGKGT